ncbi:MAG: hypothetical protein GY701_05765 [Sulfitobacter sp.]|nr:hypothetical protein [Sulfitobacter sp.]
MSKITSEHPQPQGPAGGPGHNKETRGNKPETAEQNERFHNLMHHGQGKRDHDGKKETTGKSDLSSPMSLLKGKRHGQQDKGQFVKHQPEDTGTRDKARVADRDPGDAGTRGKARVAEHEPADHRTPDKDQHDPSDPRGSFPLDGDCILQGMQSPRGADTPLESAPSTATDRISEIADKIANRIMVTDKSVSTDSEVRIQLNDSTLRGSEISIRRDQGQVVIGFTVPDSQVSSTLTPHTDDLQRSLEQRINEPVRVEVNVQSGGSDSQGDGRSRNRRDAWEEWKQDRND